MNQLAKSKPNANSTAFSRSGSDRANSPTHRDGEYRMRVHGSLATEMNSTRFGRTSHDIEEIGRAEREPAAAEYGFATSLSSPCSVLREKQVIAVTGLSRSSIWAFCNPRHRYYDPTFPKPIKLGARAVGWRASEVFLWVATRHSGAN